MNATSDNNEQYVLGHAPQELQRLTTQGEFLGILTGQLFDLAGIQPGMRVLDIGCGTGDVSFLLQSWVGAEGQVIGVDKSPEAIAVAAQRAQQAGLSNMQFIVADVNTLELDEPVDALVGRLIFTHLPQPAVTLRRLLSFVKPDGIVVIQESDTLNIITDPVCREFEIILQRVCQALTRAGVDPRTGLKLPFIFQDAGLPAPQVIQMARVEYGAHSPLYNLMGQLARSTMPLVQQTGVATPEEVGLDGIEDRIRAEALEKNAVLLLPPLIGAWARKSVNAIPA
jgi:2-polyprenyl-3-methyl-5-hydroxy-6-metoxy-1,4-benzoquinol methylase